MGLAACSASPAAGPLAKPWDQAFFTDPPAPPFLPAGTKGPLVSVCYNRLTASVAELRRMIAEACVAPRYVETDYTGNCTFTAPARVTFACRRINGKAMVIKRPYKAL